MPPIEIEIVEDRSASTPSDKGFLRVRRLTLRTRYEGGALSEPYPYDVCDRAALDAVLIVLHSPRPDAPEDPYVCMRTALRPPIALRRGRELPVPDPRLDAVIWELPAGLIEPGETGEAAVRETAARECEEETGYVVAAANFAPLGTPVYLSGGVIGEKVHVVHATVDRGAATKITTTEVVEHASKTEWWTLSDALARAARGEVEDCKTELALHRLRARLAGR